ncbi:MAG TPA: RluA family pseudouridine synthase [Lachnospiraceae bacterium]|nr:RluA family pseudouridine synthase [Lachnospiraceae bacterium]
MKEFIIDKSNKDQRFDKYIKRILKTAPDAFIYKMLRKKNIVLNGKKASGKEKLSEGDEVKIFLSDETFLKFSGPAESDKHDHLIDETFAKKNAGLFKAGILYEDEDIIIYDKPAGILSQKAKKDDISVNELLLAYLYDKESDNKERFKMFTPSVCNRLDRNTSGIILLAKTLPGARLLSSALKDRRVHKEYLALVHGNVDLKDDKEVIKEAYLKKDKDGNSVIISDLSETKGGKIISESDDNDIRIKTGIIPYKRYSFAGEDYTLLKVILYTGKTHQIRAFLSHLSHPIAGDVKYDKGHKEHYKNIKGYPKRQFLHAAKIRFPEDILSGREFESPLAPDLKDFLELISKR